MPRLHLQMLQRKLACMVIINFVIFDLMHPVATKLFDLLGVPNVPALVPLLVVIVQWKRKKRPTMNTSGPSALRNTFASLAVTRANP